MPRFPDQLLVTHEAALKCPTLGQPLPPAQVVTELRQPIQTPIPPTPPSTCQVHDDVLVGDKVSVVYTAKGWRPRVGTFKNYM